MYKEKQMKKTLLLVSLCMSIPAFASYVTQTETAYYHVCTTSDGGKSWQDAGTVHSSHVIPFDASADAVAVGRFSDCNYTGGSWTNHYGDFYVFNWTRIKPGHPGIDENFSPNAAMIFWQESQPFTHVESDANTGLDSVCIYYGLVRANDTTDCWINGQARGF